MYYIKLKSIRISNDAPTKTMVLLTLLETNHHNAQTFEAFFEGWLINQEHYLHELLLLIETNNGEENELLQSSKQLINQVMSHYKEYYEAKARIAHENVFLVFTPPWFSSLERGFLWIGGFRVGLAFRLVTNNVFDLTEDQSQRINTLMIEVKEDENELTNELNKLQEDMISSLVVELARDLGKPRNGEVAVFERLKESMEALVECADSLRMKTVIKLMQILKLNQRLRFLAATAQLQLELRRFGMQRDYEEASVGTQTAS